MKARAKAGKDVNCTTCNKLFYVGPSRLKNKHHSCSKECQGILNSKLHSKKVEVPCTICQKPVFYKLSHIKNISKPTCSMECNRKSASLRYKGNGNPSSLKLSEEDRVFKDRESNIRVRANAKKLEFSIDYIFLKELYYKQEGKCAYSGLPMQLKGKRKANEEVFSVDRIDSSKGYIKDNIVLCLNIMNRFKGDVTLEFFTKICKAIGERYNGKS